MFGCLFICLIVLFLFVSFLVRSLSCLPAYLFICLLIYNINLISSVTLLNPEQTFYFWFSLSFRFAVSFPVVVIRTQLHLLSSLWQLPAQSHTSVLFFNRMWNSSHPSHQTGRHFFAFCSYPSVS